MCGSYLDSNVYEKYVCIACTAVTTRALIYTMLVRQKEGGVFKTGTTYIAPTVLEPKQPAHKKSASEIHKKLKMSTNPQQVKNRMYTTTPYILDKQKKIYAQILATTKDRISLSIIMHLLIYFWRVSWDKTVVLHTTNIVLYQSETNKSTLFWWSRYSDIHCSLSTETNESTPFSVVEVYIAAA